MTNPNRPWRSSLFPEVLPDSLRNIFYHSWAHQSPRKIPRGPQNLSHLFVIFSNSISSNILFIVLMYTVFLQIVSAETILFWIRQYVCTVTFVAFHKSAETFQGRKLFKGGNYSRAETICGNGIMFQQHSSFLLKIQNLTNKETGK